MPAPTNNVPRTAAPPADWLAVVREKAQGLRFGVIQIVVHDSRVVQIERTERIRFDAPRHDERGAWPGNNDPLVHPLPTGSRRRLPT